MGIQRLNHAVLYVRDVTRSVQFDTDILGFRVVHRHPSAAFLRAAESDNDLGLFQVRRTAPRTTGVGLYHLAWSARRTTACRSPGTARTRTAWSSRSRGSSPATT